MIFLNFFSHLFWLKRYPLHEYLPFFITVEEEGLVDRIDSPEEGVLLAKHISILIYRVNIICAYLLPDDYFHLPLSLAPARFINYHVPCGLA